MNPLLDEDEEDLKRERELTLSTGVILGIFLVLVLLCGAFFGFGYKMGSHKAVVPLVAETTDSGAQPSSETFGGFKPSAGSPAGGNTAQPAAENPGGGDAASDAPAAESPAPAPVARTTAPPVVTTPEPTVATGSYVVQVAAVSHEEDAQLLVTALKAKGYPVSAHTEPADKFYHIQVGPFTNVKDATAAKQRLVADGYQPIIK
jgi:cell division septation protein DedD